MDNWKHRAQNMRCETCMWYAPKEGADNFGRCRRHSPTMSGFPAVFGSDWCGDHKLDENSLVTSGWAKEGTTAAVAQSCDPGFIASHD